jgi:hydrogenase-4 component B
MLLAIQLWCVLAFLGIAVVGVWLSRQPAATALIYTATAIVSAAACAAAIISLGSDQIAVLRLPLGLPLTGANFRVDALSSFFLVIINLGGAGASLFGLGYGRHESAPRRVLPFFPAFLAGMNLVVLADDAFAFLLAWDSCRSVRGRS